VVTIPTGRYLIFYDFEDEDAEPLAPPEPADAPPNRPADDV
jgi:hypothetical protein